MADFTIVDLASTGISTETPDDASLIDLTTTGFSTESVDTISVVDLTTFFDQFVFTKPPPVAIAGTIETFQVDTNSVVDLFAAAPPGPTPDITPPVVSNFNPPSGSSIAAAAGLSFDVTDDSGAFARIFAVARFLTFGVDEVIHDGDAFTARYAQQSSRVPIANGFRYTVYRYGGWQDSPHIRVYPIDGSGNQA